jgi:hypothetical protein
MARKGGKIVEVKSGQGKTYNSEKPIRGKVVVHLEDGKKMLCAPENINIVGHWD